MKQKIEGILQSIGVTLLVTVCAINNSIRTLRDFRRFIRPCRCIRYQPARRCRHQRNFVLADCIATLNLLAPTSLRDQGTYPTLPFSIVAKLLSTRLIRTAFISITVGWFIAFNQLNAQNQMRQQTTLSPKQQSIVVISSLTAKGDLQKLQTALSTGLDADLTVNEIKEVLVHLYAYCGFPRSIRGLQTFMSVLDERKKKGVTDKTGKEASPITSREPKYDRGKKVLEQLTGQPETGPKRGYSAFSPEIDVFLKEHLFADLFERDVLSYTDRELTTISALTSIGGVELMLQGHLSICLHIGLTEPQLKQALSLIETNVGKLEAEAGRTVLTQVIGSRR